MTAPMHRHRSRSNKVSLKMRLAASKNVRTRHKDGMIVTMPIAPWEDDYVGQEGNGSRAAVQGNKATTRR